MRCVKAIGPLRGFALAGAVVGAALVAAMATGGAASAATCPPPPTPLKPFLSWGDGNSYVVTTGGAFETADPGWTLAGGAKVVSGNAPNPLDPKTHTNSLLMPAGSSALSPCVTAPQIVGIVRFFTRYVDTPGTSLKVEVLVKGGTYQAGTVTPGSGWSPSPMLLSNAPAYKGAVAYQVRFTAVGSGGPVSLDDVYFDPYLST
jgi:hypothetical protein